MENNYKDAYYYLLGHLEDALKTLETLMTLTRGSQISLDLCNLLLKLRKRKKGAEYMIKKHKNIDGATFLCYNELNKNEEKTYDTEKNYNHRGRRPRLPQF